MKPALFLNSIVMVAVICLLPINISSAKSSNTVTISAVVDEHLTYIKYGNDLVVSTNSRAQYLVLSPNGDFISQVAGPTNQTIIYLPTQNFILIAQL
jgi:hypothetical protein